jgi:integrase
MNVKLRGSTYYVRFEFKGKCFIRSLKTTEKVVAQARAKKIYRSVIGGNFHDAENMKVRNDYATLEEIFKHYKENVQDIGKRTRRENVRAVEILVREVLGEDLNFNTLHCNVLTRDLVMDFQQKRRKDLGENPDYAQIERMKMTVNSAVQKAKNLFAKKLVNCDFYKDFNLPDLTPFLTAPKLKTAARSWTPLQPHEVESMQSGVTFIQANNPKLYLVHLLFSRLGLRNTEMFWARHNWIEKRDGVNCLGVVTRTDFKPKGRPGYIAIPDDVMKELLKYKMNDDDFLVPGKFASDRYRLIYREHSKWVKQFIQGRSKTSYELRKHAGSIIATRDKSLYSAQSFLRHASPVTTSSYYASLLNTVSAIESSDYKDVKKKKSA